MPATNGKHREVAEALAVERKTAPVPPHTIEPNSVYTLATASTVLHLPKSCLPREIRLNRLRVSKRAGRYYILGRWLLEWLESGERRPKPRPGADDSDGEVGRYVAAP